MHLIFYNRMGWESWGLERQPLIPEGMPVLIDEDLAFEDDGVPRPTVVANRWLRDLPLNGARSHRTWKNYAQALRCWLEFLARIGVDPLGERQPLRDALSAFSEYRFAGPLEAGSLRSLEVGGSPAEHWM